jgi:hypothetical protein
MCLSAAPLRVQGLDAEDFDTQRCHVEDNDASLTVEIQQVWFVAEHLVDTPIVRA